MGQHRILVPTIHHWHPKISAIQKLFKLYISAREFAPETDTVYFDFSECEFFANHAAVFLGGLDRFLKEKYRFSEITYGSYCNPEVETYLTRVGYFNKMQGWSQLPYSDFSLDDIRRKKPYEDINQLLEQPDFPFRRKADRDVIKSKIGELFLNVLQHSQSPAGCSASAQFYPSEDRFRFAIVDYGIGISENIRRFFLQQHAENISPGEALLKAFEEHFTTKAGANGLGLKEIKAYVLQNQGKISIFCNTVFYQYNGRKDQAGGYQLKTPEGFDGTYIVIDFDTQNIC